MKVHELIEDGILQIPTPQQAVAAKLKRQQRPMVAKKVKPITPVKPIKPIQAVKPVKPKAPVVPTV